MSVRQNMGLIYSLFILDSGRCSVDYNTLNAGAAKPDKLHMVPQHTFSAWMKKEVLLL